MNASGKLARGTAERRGRGCAIMSGRLRIVFEHAQSVRLGNSTPAANGLSRTRLRSSAEPEGDVDSAAIAEPSLRERNKAERRRRVLEAARDVFREFGYDDATTREIATRAGVAVGTVFVYARDKRDLLMMIVNDDLEAVTEASFAALDGDAAVARQADRAVRAALSLLGARSGALDVRTARNRIRTRQRSAERNRTLLQPPLQDHRQDRRRWSTPNSAPAGSGTPDDPQTIALLLMGIYLAHARFWLSDADPQVPDGIARLRRQFELAMNGLRP